MGWSILKACSKRSWPFVLNFASTLRAEKPKGAITTELIDNARRNIEEIGHADDIGLSERRPRGGFSVPAIEFSVRSMLSGPCTAPNFSRYGTLRRGHAMRDFIVFVLLFGVILFLLAYFFLINPDLLTEFGYWLQNFF